MAPAEQIELDFRTRNFILTEIVSFRLKRWTVLLLTWISWIFALVTVTRCTFIKIVSDDESSSDIKSLGLFSVPIYTADKDIRGCVSYESNDGRTGGFKAGRAFSIFLVVTISIAFVIVNGMMLFIQTHMTRRLMYLLVRVCVPVAFIANTLTFVTFSMEECSEKGTKCSPGGAAIVAILNVLVLFILAVLVIVTPAPSQCAFQFVYDFTKVAPRDHSGQSSSSEQKHAQGDIYRSPPKKKNKKNIFRKRREENPENQDDLEQI
jgi:hypothetical protein